MVLVDMEGKTPVSRDNILYKCGWSPFEGTTFDAQIEDMGKWKGYQSGKIMENKAAMRLTFNR